VVARNRRHPFELTAVGGRFSKKSGFDITIKRRRLVAAADPPTCEFYFYNIDIGDLPMPIRRCSSRLRCRRFSMSDVYIGRTLVPWNFAPRSEMALELLFR